MTAKLPRVPPLRRYAGAAHTSVFVVLILLAAVAAFFVGFRYPAPQLTLTTEPQGASVFLNGRLAGATPLKLTGITPGSYGLRIEKEGFRPLLRSLELKSGDMVLNETLALSGTGFLKVAILPAGAEVLLDGEFQGHTPLNLTHVSMGMHDLLVRKTNFKSYAQRIEVDGEHPLEFKDFVLEDNVLKMLRDAVENENTRVSHYLDLGHYLFVNDMLDESAEVYARAQQVAASPIVFPPETDQQERALDIQHRAEDVNRLNEELRKKQHWPGKNVDRFIKVVEQQREKVANSNVNQWVWVREQVSNLIRDQKLEPAEDLLQRHIVAGKGTSELPQAYIELISLRLRMHKLDRAKEAYQQFSDLYGHQPVLLRQAANGMYSFCDGFQGDARKEVLSMAEKLLRKALEGVPKRNEAELAALCEFELANVLTLENRFEAAVPFYEQSIANTSDNPTKELRRQKLVENLKKQQNYVEAIKILAEMAKSPRKEIAEKAKADLAELANTAKP